MPRVPPVTNATRAMSNSSLVVFLYAGIIPVFGQRLPDENARRETGHSVFIDRGAGGADDDVVLCFATYQSLRGLLIRLQFHITPRRGINWTILRVPLLCRCRNSFT